MTRSKNAERQRAIEELRTHIKPGDTVYTILDSVSRSGMSRTIRVVLLACDNGRAVDLHPNYLVSQALGIRQGKRRDGLIVGGCGMDMGFHLVYELSHVLYGSGYACLGKGQCPSNYHSNHRNTIQCKGTRRHNPDGPDFGSFCYRPDGFLRNHAVPDDWPRLPDVRLEDGTTYPGPCAACITQTETGEECAPFICPTCQGIGSLPNPEGPERFDLIHTDGYAVRQRWL